MSLAAARGPAAAAARFTPVDRCWICGGAGLRRFHLAPFDCTQFEHEDPDLFAYSGERVWIVRCTSCGFGQPEQLPTLTGYFDRMYNQRWSDEWVRDEFAATYKDVIFRRILRELAHRSNGASRTLLDVGAHAGRFMSLAQRDGWQVEGIELNPRTAAYAQVRTGAPVHQINAHALTREGRRYGAVVLTDVLEHIPDPGRVLASVASLLEPGGSIAVKVPNGPAQWAKERMLAAVSSHRVSLADNLVHVNHFSPRSLRLALQRAGFTKVTVRTAAPELPDVDWRRPTTAAARAVRLGVFAAASLPGGTRTLLALNLQAYGTKLR